MPASSFSITLLSQTSPPNLLPSWSVSQVLCSQQSMSLKEQSLTNHSSRWTQSPQ